MSYNRINWIDRIPGYHYYDTPDGEDCFKKVIYMNKLGAFFGISAATLDVIAISKPVGAGAIALRYCAITYPLMAIGSAFAAVTCISTNLRGKDDTYNYFFGGFAAGCVSGAAMKHAPGGFCLAVLFGLAGYVKKTFLMEGYLFFPKDVRHAYGGIWSIHYDWTLTKDKPRGWRMSESED